MFRKLCFLALTPLFLLPFLPMISSSQLGCKFFSCQMGTPIKELHLSWNGPQVFQDVHIFEKITIDTPFFSLLRCSLKKNIPFYAQLKAQGVLDLKQIDAKEDEVLETIMTLFNISKQNLFQVVFSPTSFRLENGILELDPMDFCLAGEIHLCLGGL